MSERWLDGATCHKVHFQHLVTSLGIQCMSMHSLRLHETDLRWSTTHLACPIAYQSSIHASELENREQKLTWGGGIMCIQLLGP